MNEKTNNPPTTPDTDDVESTESVDELLNANNDEKPISDKLPDDTPDLEPNSDSRNNSRVNLNRPILIHLSNGETVKAHMINISSDGLAFEYPAPAEAGATFVLLFQLVGKDGIVNIQAEGIARHSHVRSESFVTDIEFTKIAEEHVETIEAFVEYRLSAANQLTGYP